MDKELVKNIDVYMSRLFPIHRSITGDGNRETLNILREIVDIKVKEYPTGKKVYDWVIPREWIIRDAWIKNSKGEKIVDYSKSNLHVVSYSEPVHKKISFVELKQKLCYLENLPDAIPYRTSYYHSNWGFCLSFNDYKSLLNENEEYEVFIDSELKDGSMTIGEVLIPGEMKKEVLISTYFCHPSLANDNLSGVLLTAFLAKAMKEMKLNYSYRIVFVPETIGAITYCSVNEDEMKAVDFGLVVATVGGPGKLGYKQSFDSSHFLNNIVEDVFDELGEEYKVYPFTPDGSDERQYSSPAFRINVVTISKDKYYDYNYYHTSLDDLNFISAENIAKTYECYMMLINKIDKNLTYKNIHPYCEVMLSKHNLYPKTGGALLPDMNNLSEVDIISWILFLSDGDHSLYDISKRIKVPIERLNEIAIILEEKNLLIRSN